MLLIGCLFFYLYGSISLGYFLMLVFRSERLNAIGDENIGPVVAFRRGGILIGALSGLFEASKAVMAVLAGDLFFRNLYACYLFLLFAILGSCFPVFFNFKGGKGRTVAGWGFVLLSPLSLVLLAGFWLLLFAILHKASKVFRVLSFLIPLSIGFFENDMFVLLLTSMMAILFYFNSNDSYSIQ